MEKCQSYSELYTYLEGEIETSPSLESYKGKINTSSKKKSTTIYLLILEHYQRNHRSDLPSTKIPYSGKKASKSGGVKYQINQLPDRLQSIIAAYISKV